MFPEHFARIGIECPEHLVEGTPQKNESSSGCDRAPGYHRPGLWNTPCRQFSELSDDLTPDEFPFSEIDCGELSPGRLDLGIALWITD